jgi:hypothetical protein
MKIDEKARKVWLTGTASNEYLVDPVTGRERRYFRKFEASCYSRLLCEKGRAAVEEDIAMSALEGGIKFYSGKFYDWCAWFYKRINADPELREKTEYTYAGTNDPEGQARDREAERLRVALWKEYCARPSEPKKDYYVVNGNNYASKVTSRRLYLSPVKTVFHAKKSDLERRLANFIDWEIREA